jgi:hypothetical protein
MAVLKVFPSYARENQSWKEAFIRWFKPGNVEVEDYLMGGGLPFGNLEQWLNEQINAAGVFLAIISRDYIGKKYPLAEWWKALSETARRKLVFVPVLIDAEAKGWWAELKRQGHLHHLGDDYAYSDFTNAYGKARDINGEYGPITEVTGKIESLAHLIQEHLRPAKNEEQAAGAGATPPDASEHVAPNVLLLGHPTVDAYDPVAKRTDELFVKLKSLARISAVRWPNGWRNEDLSHEDFASAISNRATFVQPLRPAEAGDHALKPEQMLGWLQQAAAEELWTASRN